MTEIVELSSSCWNPAFMAALSLGSQAALMMSCLALCSQDRGGRGTGWSWWGLQRLTSPRMERLFPLLTCAGTEVLPRWALKLSPTSKSSSVLLRWPLRIRECFHLQRPDPHFMSPRQPATHFANLSIALFSVLIVALEKTEAQMPSA